MKMLKMHQWNCREIETKSWKLFELLRAESIESKCKRGKKRIERNARKFPSYAWLTVITRRLVENGIINVCRECWMPNVRCAMCDVHIMYDSFSQSLASLAPCSLCVCCAVSLCKCCDIDIPYPLDAHRVPLYVKTMETKFSIFEGLPAIECREYFAISVSYTNTGKTVKTNKLVIGIMVIQLIFVSSVCVWCEANECAPLHR